MKQSLIIVLLTAASLLGFTQQKKEGNRQMNLLSNELTTRNSWLKLGILAGIPAGNLSNTSNFTVGADLRAQLMVNRNVGIGLTAGYNHFFPKDKLTSFGLIPLGTFIRWYPAKEGFFAGADLGYALMTGVPDPQGGVYARPQIGYHNYSWNVFGIYNQVFRADGNGGNIQYVGVGCSYNIRFN